MKRIGIIGGGLSGLSLGYFLKKRGIKNFTILEKDNVVGGKLMRSFKHDGFTFDFASHVIFSRNQKILNIMLRLLGLNITSKRRNTKIFYKGNFIKYPFENGLNDLPLNDNFECLFEFVKTLIQKHKLPKPKNLREWCYYTFGKGIAEKYLIPYNNKVWNFPAKSISTEWVERIPNPPVDDIIKSSLGIDTEGYKHQLRFFYPKRGGIMSLPLAIEKRIKGKIIKDYEVVSIKKSKKKWIVCNGQKKTEFDNIISTIPIFDLVRCLDDIPEDVLKAVRRLKYSSLATVFVGLKKPLEHDFSWMYFPGAKDGKFNRVAFLSNYSRYNAPKGNSCLIAETTYRKLSDVDTIDKTIDNLNRAGIIEKDDVCYSNCVGTKYAYVIPDLKYSKNISIVRRFFKRKGIVLCGRFSQFEYINMDAAIENAQTEANRNEWRR